MILIDSYLFLIKFWDYFRIIVDIVTSQLIHGIQIVIGWIEYMFLYKFDELCRVFLMDFVRTQRKAVESRVFQPFTQYHYVVDSNEWVLSFQWNNINKFGFKVLILLILYPRETTELDTWQG